MDAVRGNVESFHEVGRGLLNLQSALRELHSFAYLQLSGSAGQGLNTNGFTKLAVSMSGMSQGVKLDPSQQRISASQDGFYLAILQLSSKAVVNPTSGQLWIAINGAGAALSDSLFRWADAFETSVCNFGIYQLRAGDRVEPYIVTANNTQILVYSAALAVIRLG